jgi:hypothetical protein
MAEAVNTITIEQVKATVTDLLAQKDAEKAVATEIAGLKTTIKQTEADLTAAKAEATELAGKLTKKDQDIDAVRAELAAANKKVAEVESAKADLQKQVTHLQTEKVQAARVAKLTEKGIASEDRVSRLTARNEDGTFKVSDDLFEQMVADMVEVAEAAKKAMTDKQKKDADEAKDTDKQKKDAAKASSDTTETPAAPAIEPDAATRAVSSLMTGKAPEGSFSREAFAKSIRHRD